MRELWCIVLAAGGSRRLGRPKQLLRYRARPLLLHAIDAARAVTPRRIVVVLGARHARLRALLRRQATDVPVVRNPRWRRGMAGSLRAGLDALPARASAALILLADQPLIDAAALEALILAWRDHPRAAAAASYQDRIGVPAVLPRALWSRARRLQGDRGARTLLRDALDTTIVPIPGSAVDIDTAADAATLAAEDATGPSGRRWLRSSPSRSVRRGSVLFSRSARAASPHR